MVLQKPEDIPQDVPTPPAGSVVVPPPLEEDDIADIPQTPDDLPQEQPLNVPSYTPKPQSRELSDSTRNILLVISGVFLLMAICSAWLLYQNIRNKDDDKKPTSSQAPTTTEAPKSTAITCADDLTIYKNQDLGFGFCYPAIWGAVKVADGKLASADTGKRWKVSFADKKAVQVDMLTKDWSTKKTNEFACVPTTAKVPAFAPLVTTWTEQKEAEAVVSASRDIEAAADAYVIREFTESETLKGACLQGYAMLQDSDYDHAVIFYNAPFAAAITTPQQHEAVPETLISAADRGYLAALAQSVLAIK